jgi:hypothetical protein
MALGAFLMAATAPIRAQEAIPQAFPKDRYDQLREHSPFSLATVPAPAAAPGPSFADNWFVSGIARIGDDDFVTIKSRDLSKQFSLFANETDRETGVSVASVNWSDTVGKSTVILRKGTETAKLEFNEAEIHTTPQAANPIAPPGGIPSANIPGGPRPPLPQPGSPQGLPMPNVNPAAARMRGAATPPVRRRSQVIQPPQ